MHSNCNLLRCSQQNSNLPSISNPQNGGYCYKVTQLGFFFFWGVSQAAKNFACPLNLTPSPLFDQSLSPLNWVLSPKISKIPTNFSLNFDYFLAQNCIRKSYFKLKTPKFVLICCRGHFWPQRTIFPSPLLTWLCPRCKSPLTPSQRGSKSSLKASTPHQKFCEKPWVTMIKRDLIPICNFHESPGVILGHHKSMTKIWPCCTSAFNKKLVIADICLILSRSINIIMFQNMPHFWFAILCVLKIY